MADKKIGKVVHYYDKIGVAVVELAGPLAKGDTIKFVKNGEELFGQQVASMQSEHQDIDKAKKGESVGMKVDQAVKDGVEVYKA